VRETYSSNNIGHQYGCSASRQETVCALVMKTVDLTSQSNYPKSRVFISQNFDNAAIITGGVSLVADLRAMHYTSCCSQFLISI
jgi:hypothetical protein